ncbi:glycosyltransferase family 4 protein [Leptospira idonii]|uniref:Glycosyltransferase family 1 protein n=1 Tax=Leptospira idonii TaxID=1193500 RepID=A0A4R9LVN0_9LEPT|nr:glycosyltransferase family 1 protein [Leptospira idonii]TGN18304.1 glycosyltransferase family 1 protein [Leptospira idonii]
MKIGIDAYVARFPLTGIGNYTFSLAKHLEKYYPENKYCYFLKDDYIHDRSFSDYLRDKEKRFVLSSYFRNRFLRRVENKIKTKFFQGILSSESYFKLCFSRLEDELFRLTEDLDLYHGIDWYFHVSPKVKRKILTVHDLTSVILPGFHDRMSVGKEIAKSKNLDAFDLFLSVSDSTKNDLIRYYGVAENKIKTVYQSCDPIFDDIQLLDKQAVLSKYSIPTDRPYFLSVSTIEPRKNFIKVLESYQNYKDRTGDSDSILVCTGLWGWKNKELSDCINRHPYSDSIFFTGYLDLSDMPTLYHYASGFLYLSVYEGFGLPILEAMKSKVPVICSNTSSMPEVIGDCGWLVAPNDVNAVVDAMIELKENKESVSLKSEKAYERSKNFNWQRTAKETFESYQS